MESLLDVVRRGDVIRELLTPRHVKAERRAEIERRCWAESVVKLLRRRGFEVDDALEQRVRGSDIEQLSEWFDRAPGATRIDEVFVGACAADLTVEQRRIQGQAEGEAHANLEIRIWALLSALQARGYHTDSATKWRIQRTTDVRLLDEWLRVVLYGPRARKENEYRPEFAGLDLVGRRWHGFVTGVMKGQFEGGAATLLLVLQSRGFTVDDALKKRVHASTDEKEVAEWLERAIRGEPLEEVLEPIQE